MKQFRESTPSVKEFVYNNSKLFDKGTKVKSVGLYTDAPTKIAAINSLFKKCNYPLMSQEDEKHIAYLEDNGYLFVSEDDIDAFDFENDEQYKYYVEFIFEI